MVTDKALEIQTAESFINNAPPALHRSLAFRSLPAQTQAQILQDLHAIGRALADQPKDPYDLALDTPEDFWRRRAGVSNQPTGQSGDQSQPASPTQPAARPAPGAGPVGQTRAATATIAARAGALSDEINFPASVAGLVHRPSTPTMDPTTPQMTSF